MVGDVKGKHEKKALRTAKGFRRRKKVTECTAKGLRKTEKTEQQSRVNYGEFKRYGMELTTGIVTVGEVKRATNLQSSMKAKRKVKCSRVTIVNVKMEHGHDTITEHPMEEKK